MLPILSVAASIKSKVFDRMLGRAQRSWPNFGMPLPVNMKQSYPFMAFHDADHIDICIGPPAVIYILRKVAEKDAGTGVKRRRLGQVSSEQKCQ